MSVEGSAPELPDQVVLSRANLTELMSRLETAEKNAAAAKAATTTTAAPANAEAVSITKAELEAMLARAVAIGRGSATVVIGAKPRVFEYDPSVHPAVDVRGLHGHTVVATGNPEVLGELIDVHSGETYNDQGSRLGRVVPVLHKVEAAAA